MEDNSSNKGKMKVISDSEFIDFLIRKPLYSKILAVSNFEKNIKTYTNPVDFCNKAFKLKCPNEKEIQTFKTELTDKVLEHVSLKNLIEPMELPFFFDKSTQRLDMTLHIVGRCQSCGAKADFLLKTYSNATWDKRKDGISITIQKIGQFPPFEISPESAVDKYLLDEDKENYKKALANLSISYGIGAFAYFRRIIENEIKRIIDDISTLDFEGADRIKEALIAFETDHQMANLINVINKFLPKSLTELGDNPIRLLYEQLSTGIHKLSDEECFEKAQMIDTILTYVIKKVNEEKYQISNVKQAMKKLRNG